MTSKLFIFISVLSVAFARITIYKRCTDCNHVGGFWVNNVAADTTNDDPPQVKDLHLDEVYNDRSIIGLNNVGGQHQLLSVSSGGIIQREERCSDCGNVGGNHHVTVNECTDCYNNGGRHTNNNILPNGLRHP